MSDVLVRWILTLWITPTRQFLWSLEQQFRAEVQWLLIGCGGYPQPLPVTMSNPLRRDPSHSRILLERTGRNTGVVQTTRRFRPFLS
jgi:hypothetical protein